MAHSVDEWLGALWQVMPRGKAWSRDEDGDLNLFTGVSQTFKSDGI
ncbi:hypothetical protein [Citrobacter freundii]|nr:hypothetical protein [Citrobacter freundii]